MYDEAYYERGEALGISGYTNYRWMPGYTIPFCNAVVKYLSLKRTDAILDFGCAKGFVVRALYEMGFDKVQGCDISEYAIRNADAIIRHRLHCVDDINKLDQHFDWIISKDVLEHISYDAIGEILQGFHNVVDNVFCIIPLGDGKYYNVPEYENDITHCIREDAVWWINQFTTAGFTLSSFSMRICGIKDNWAHYSNGNGFFRFKRQ